VGECWVNRFPSKSRDDGPRASKKEYAIECSNNFILLILFLFVISFL